MIERRTNHLTRKFVAEMSQKAQKAQKAKRRTGHSSDKTGLPDRRAFDEGKISPFVAMSDVNSLRAMNDRFGHASGDILIRRLAEVFTSVGLDAYHDQGGTFLCKAESHQELNLKLSQAQQTLRQEIFSFSGDGRTRTIQGVHFCFGIGTTLEEAELSLYHQKDLQRSKLTQ
jgi:GGDEF domain-containing protein